MTSLPASTLRRVYSPGNIFFWRPPDFLWIRCFILCRCLLRNDPGNTEMDKRRSHLFKIVSQNHSWDSSEDFHIQPEAVRPAGDDSTVRSFQTQYFLLQTHNSTCLNVLPARRTSQLQDTSQIQSSSLLLLFNGSVSRADHDGIISDKRLPPGCDGCTQKNHSCSAEKRTHLKMSLVWHWKGNDLAEINICWIEKPFLLSALNAFRDSTHLKLKKKPKVVWRHLFNRTNTEINMFKMQITRRCLCAGPAVSAARGLAVTVQVCSDCRWFWSKCSLQHLCPGCDQVSAINYCK